MQVLAIIGLSTLLFAGSEAQAGWNSGAGVVYTLPIAQDVCLERGSTNYDWLQYLIVGLHPQYPKKRSLLQFESLPSECTRIHWAKMYVYFVYAHKASWYSVNRCPYISRTVQVYQVKQQWNETEATSAYRLRNTLWNAPYLALDDSDANSYAIGSATIFTGRPAGFVEFDITEAMRNWQYGDPNYGVLLMATNEDEEGRGLRFASNTSSDSSRHAFVRVLCD